VLQQVTIVTMYASQRVELAIYKRIKALGPSGVTLSLGMLVAEMGQDTFTIVERLKALEADNRITLWKYSGGHREPRERFSGDAAFFYTGSFIAEVVPQGRRYFEELEEQAEKETQQQSVFISCGQFLQPEIALGQELAAMVTQNTKCRGYFAENQSSLEGLSVHIFRALDQCAGFVAVMHHRGTVELGGNKHIRGSVWIEQEIAIAAFLTQTRNRDIPVLMYIQKGIKREGVREQLKLNPVEFENEAEVTVDFLIRLKNGTFRC
jgi:hypothetical protein